MEPASRSSTLRPKPGLASRSGETSRTSTVPAPSSASICPHASMFDELRVAAVSPARSAAATWSRISDNNGDTTRVGPAPSLRLMAVAAQ